MSEGVTRSSVAFAKLVARVSHRRDRFPSVKRPAVKRKLSCMAGQVLVDAAREGSPNLLGT